MGYVLSVGLEGMKGHKVMVEANVRDEKEAMLSDEQERFIQSNSEASISVAIDRLPTDSISDSW
ncbi:hypothetical protein NSQ43_15775 [Sporosarcina sp. FSL W8-0480]|uniref:hypothetical protein n=1 Tax=Sporosarcina sp. FSL W8-0480 TaxID=2954701 RepID=UPI0030D96C7F